MSVAARDVLGTLHSPGGMVQDDSGVQGGRRRLPQASAARSRDYRAAAGPIS
ncbi:hypothetical protein AB0B15_41770 [Streptomyces sp. NPDC045456]|uniref:hypothetical protein n=1 Tax=Streptomyces sp. NPDC045456 TaxID=3155254 RepID=UPI0033FF5C64